MGDHFVLLVDRLLTESTLEAAIESKNRLQQAMPSENENIMTDFSSHRVDVNAGFSLRKLVECRICHDEDEDSNMEIPCSCCGSLKYAHRRCIQRWCNEKGDTICEICHQQFKPGYTAPPPLFHYGGIPMNFRGNWEISRRDLQNPQFIAMVATDRNFLDHNFDDYSAPTSRSLICFRVVAIIESFPYMERIIARVISLLLDFFRLQCPIRLPIQFMVLLVLRHTLRVIISGAGQYSVTLFMLLMLRTIAILLPIYIMVRAFTAIQRRRHQQEPHNFSLATLEEESALTQLQPQPHLIHVQ